MGEAKRRASLVSVLIPERGRPEELDRLICSLLDTAGSDEAIEILVAIDTDDPEWVDREPMMHSRTRYFRRERPQTLGEKLNLLAKESLGSILFFLANDYIVETPGWPQRFRDAVAQLPNGIGVPFPHDDLHPDHSAFPIISRKTMEAVGFFMPPPYPYWFIDTHWDHLGILMGQHFEIDVTVRAPEGRGRSHGLIDLPFWVQFFNALAPLRLREAIQMIAAAWGEGTPAFMEAMKSIEQRQRLCAARVAHLSSPLFLERWSGNAASSPAPGYAAFKAQAQRMMEDIEKSTPRRPKVMIAVPSGRQWEGTTALCVAALASYSTACGIQIAMCNVQTSEIAHGRNSSVEIALRDGFDWVLWCDSDMKFPADLLMRLLKHDKDIVGCLYCKRVADANGNYPVLGRLKGKHPDRFDDGLHEALLMPGGLILVKTEVYRKLSWPYYAQAYRWPGADGLEAMKGLLRNFFYYTPSEEVLASLDGTAFGDWIKDHYVLGEDGEHVPTFSEDLWLIRRARKAGFTAWADIKLSSECFHLGEHAVGLQLGQEVVRLSEAAE